MKYASWCATEHRPGRLTLLAAIFGLSTAPISLALAETEGPALQEVVVTAERQGAESVQNAPIAISVVDPQALSRQNATEFNDYLTSLPSVDMQTTGPGMNKFNIRGLSAEGFNQTDTQDRTLVSVYLDDTPISIQGDTPDLGVLDLQRIEVVRGPQGTLYGAGAMAGNIRLITVKPSLDAYSGTVESTVSHTDNGTGSYSARGLVNAPLVDGTLGIRAAVFHAKDSGYIDNLGTREDHANGDDKTQARVALRYKPTDRLTIDASTTYETLRTDGLNVSLLDLGKDNYSSNIPETYHDHLNIYNATVAYDAGFANLTSSTSLINRQFGLIYSWQYALNRYIYHTSDAGTQSIIGPDNIGNKLQDFDEEIKINSTTDGPLHWLLGAFFQHESRDYLQDIVNPGLDALFGGGPFAAQALGAPVPDDAYHGTQNVNEKNRAVFGELKYNILPNLAATVGLRYFNFTQSFNLYQAGIFGVQSSLLPLTSSGNAHETGTNPRFALSYNVNDSVMIFAEAAKGFRYGGVNYPLPNTCADFSIAPQTFDPDHLWSYQIGEKSTLLDKRLTFNATAFLIDWSNVQTRKVDTSCSYYFIVAGGKVQSRGIELETSMKLTDRLTASVNASYTDATADGALPNVGAVDGDRTPYTPKTIASVSLDYVLPLAQNQLDFMVNWRYRGDEHTDFNQTSSDYFQLPSNNQTNIAINYITPRYEVGVYGRNIFNSQEVLDEGTNYAKPPTVTNYGGSIYYGRTAVFGLRGAVKF